MSELDLSCNYLGLKLKSPLVPSSSPLSRSLDSARELEDAGAAAIVMYSLFEEELEHEDEMHARFVEEQSIGCAEADSYLPMHGTFERGIDRYLRQLSELKAHLEIPVIASLNGITLDNWIAHSKALQQAGADALELNVYYMATDCELRSGEVEGRYIKLLRALKNEVSLPVAMKLSPQFSALPHFVKELEAAGAAGVSLFNRFYQPDIDIDALKVTPQIQLSRSADALLAMRWIGVLRDLSPITLAATGGIHTAEDAIKMILAGADVTHLCSVLLESGSHTISEIYQGIEHWMEQQGFESLDQVRGVLSQQNSQDEGRYERANYLWVLDSYSAGEGVR
ncbi:dihydroorotate dehydrogenase [Solemya pervernicosa gill symbiont]|uniref:Dihydroorotate dehydrogenase n=2 Tax=Gammaproteobacteria incertae sedis TaxID=118884 RepID=A0A1T2L559_9GAMM|nr:dihydroorotate dehydrogenase-like protein [Candidatus Reidiella endopervernicosa]OOZ40219.1 dihydroorotate dehydrogenase [Solemya pervernicosa gill symbiont]QKQ27124.1 dihydroorotate dehydrogenase-like protein [Candidatus Reidiella endopervernicosa]